MFKSSVFFYTHNKMGVCRDIPEAPIDYSELTILVKGELTYWVNGVSHHMTDGDIIYLPEGSLRARSATNQTNDYFSFNFHLGENVFDENHITGCLSKELWLLLSYLDSVNAGTSADAPDTEITNRILDCILLQIQKNIRDSQLSPLIKKIVKYVSEHYMEQITLKTVAEVTYFSPSYCENRFKKEMGKSIINYLIDVRISEAKNLISGSALPLAEISDTVGFEDYNYFARIFKKRVGYTPRQYRRLFERL